MAERTFPKFSIVPLGVVGEKGVTLIELKLEVALAGFQNRKSKDCFPSIKTLSEVTGAGKREVRRGLRRLRSRGRISWNERQRENGSTTSHFYTLHFMDAIDGGGLEAPEGSEAPEGLEAPGGDGSEAPGGDGLEAPEGDGPEAPPFNKGLNSQSNSQSNRDIIYLGDFPKKKIEEIKKDRPKPKPKPSKASRIDPDWKPTTAGNDYAIDKGFSDKQIPNIVEKFVDHWLADASPKALKKDWNAAWRTWVRNDIKFHGHPGMRPGGKPTKSQLAG